MTGGTMVEVEEEVVGTIAKGEQEVRATTRKGTYGEEAKTIADDDEYDRPRYDDRRPQRRRYEDPPSVRVRKQILEIAQSVSVPLS